MKQLPYYSTMLKAVMYTSLVKIHKKHSVGRVGKENFKVQRFKETARSSHGSVSGLVLPSSVSCP